jgi:outer membrane protein
MSSELRFIKRSLFLGFFVSLIFPANADTSQPINFPQAVSMALSANPRMSESKASVESAQAEITQAHASMLPQLGLESNAARSDNPLNVFGYKLSQGQVTFADFGAAQFNSPSSLNTAPKALNDPGYYGNVDNGLVITMPLFSGGSDLAKSKRAQLLLKAAEAGNQEARLELTFDVLQAYEGVHTTNALVAIAKQSLQAMNDYTHLTQGLSKQSLVLQSDVLLAQTAYRSAQMTLKNVVAQNNNQLDSFRILLGQPQSQLVPGTPVHLQLPKQSMQTIQDSAYLSNAQLSALKSQMDAEQTNITSADAGYWPTLDLQLRHDWNAPNFNLSNPSNTALLEMNWTLFDFGMRSGATQEAKAKYQEAIAKWANAKNDINLSIVQTLRAIQTTSAQIQSSDLNAQQSLAMVKVLKEKYGQAVVPLSALLDAQARLDTAQAQQVMTRYDLLLAQAKLLMLINQLAPSNKSAES